MAAKRSKERLHDLLENSDQGEILYQSYHQCSADARMEVKL